MATRIPADLTSKPRFFYGYIIVACMFLIMLVAIGANYAFGTFLKPVSEQFNWGRAATSGAFSLCQLVSGLMGIILGSLNDKLGPRKVLTACGILIGIGFLLMSQINSLWQLYFFYGVIIGIGMGGGYVPILSTVARWFTKRRSFMSGIVLIGLSLGTLIAPPVSNKLIETFDWRTSYIIIGLVVLIVMVAASQFLKRDPSIMGLKADGGEKDAEKISIVEGLSLKEASRTAQFWIFMGMEFVFGIILMTFTVHIIPHASDLGFSSGLAAGSLAVAGGFSIPGRIVLGHAADRLGNRYVYIIGFLLMSGGLFWLLFIKEIWMLYLFAAVFGFANGGVEASESPIAAWLFGMKSHGLIFGVLVLGFTMGSALGPFVAGYLFDIYGSYQVAFLTMAILGFIGLILTITLKPVARRKIPVS